MIHRLLSAVALLVTVGLIAAQPSAPTLTPPTPIPFSNTAAQESAASESIVARIAANQRVRIGVMYTEPPFGEFTPRGEVRGYDADLARLLAELWGVELRIRQVTRQTSLEMLETGEVDLLIAAQIHQRGLDRQFEFSQTYHIGGQAMMVRSDDSAQTLMDLNGRKLGVLVGSTSEETLRTWATQVAFTGQIETYLTDDRLYGALGGGQVDAIVSGRHHLRHLASFEPEARRILAESILDEPYAVMMRRQDAPLRDLVNQSLQILQRDGKLDELRRAHFADVQFDGVPIWANLPTDAPKPDQFSATIPYPSQYAVARLQNDGVVRIAGAFLTPEQLTTATESEKRLERFNQDLIAALTRRWNVRVEQLNASPTDAARLVSEGQADLAMGVPPDWTLAQQVDFSQPYLIHGLRLMVPSDSEIFGFEELRGGRTVATTFNEPGSNAAAIREAERVNALIDNFQTSEDSLALQILEDRNADVAFADSFKLMVHLEAYPSALTLTDTWYSREYYAFALPRNDADFRLLVEYSLQALVNDGTLERLWRGLIPPDNYPNLEVTPGSGDFLGYSLGG